MKFLAFATAAVALTLGAGSAFAADAFTLLVPVEFKSLNPEVKSVLIHCALSGEDRATRRNRTFGRPKSLSLPIVNGNYTGFSPVKVVFAMEDFSSQERALLNDVREAQCGFDLVTDRGTLAPANGATNDAILMHRPNTPYETVSRGAVPK